MHFGLSLLTNVISDLVSVDICAKIIMADSSTLLVATVLLLFFHFTEQSELPLSSTDHCRSYHSLFCFGDSLSDTGNLLFSDANASAGRPPYGQTFFHRPTGRSSDGRLIIDFLAESMGIPYLIPYLPHSRDENIFEWGANFAVGGATALSSEFFARAGIDIGTPYSLNVQLSWFHQLLPFICPPPPYDCGARLRRTLFVVGEIGGNDYSSALNHGWSIERVKSTLVPKVIGVTESAIISLVEAGASSFLAPGIVGLGCLPMFLTGWPGKSKDDYEQSTGCLVELNELCQFHDQQLKKMLDRLQELHPHISIVFADLYQSAMRLFRSPHKFGINETLRTCCGIGGKYNFDNLHQCGDPGVEACKNPQSYLIWDGIHGTDMFYRFITQGLLEGPYTTPPFSKCQPVVAQA